MKVFIAGSTGVLGKRLVNRFVDAGHRVIGLTRDEEGDRVVEGRGGEPRRGDILDEKSLQEAVDDVDVVIHAATAIPVDVKVKREDWELNDRVRREGTRNLVEVTGEVGATQYLQQSITWVVRNDDGSVFDETSEPNTDYVTQSALDAEQIAKEGGDQHGFSVGVLRCGSFYSADSDHTRLMGRLLLDGRLPVIGGGVLGRRDAAVSFLHVDDAAHAFLAVADKGASGLWHVVDEEPVTYNEFITELAERLGASPPRRIPAWLARFFVGSYNAKFFSTPIPTTNERFKEELGWEPEYPSVREGLDEVVNEWVEEGTLRSVDNGYEWTAEN